MTGCLTPNSPPHNIIVGSLLVVLILLALPHAANLGAGPLVFFLLVAIWRAVAITHPTWLPKRWLLFILTLLGIGIVLASVSLFNIRLLGTALLVVMLGLKLLEVKARRDVYVCTFLGFFLAITHFLFRQDLWLAIYLLTLSGMLVAILIMLNRVHLHRGRTATAALRAGLSALPLTVALFILFPRLESPLWALQIANAGGITGISDRMQMGAISQLSRSGATAFRVRFQQSPPNQSDFYWRGLVLTHFDGRTWTPDSGIDPATELQIEPTSRMGYELVMEPSNQPWIFALDLPSQVPQALIYNQDYRVINPEPITERSTFQLVSHTRYQALGMNDQQWQQALQLPQQIGHRTIALVDSWLQQHGDDNPNLVVAQALEYFNQQPFVYTLTPGKLNEQEPIEQFLFDTRRGFCEHYASSFAVLMRLAGIPTRVILGYQGGEWNPRAEHWTIRQSDAHAWTEVWFEDRGWVRVDPTASVAPERIEQSIDVAQSTPGNPVVYRIDDKGLLKGLWQEARWMVDAVEIGWHRWVIGFSHTTQTNLLDYLGLGGLGGYRHMLAFVGVILIGGAFAYLIGLIRYTGRATDPTHKLWQRLIRKLANAGLPIAPWYGPCRVIDLACQNWPDQSLILQQIGKTYNQLRYGASPQRSQRGQLARLIKSLKCRSIQSKVK